MDTGDATKKKKKGRPLSMVPTEPLQVRWPVSLMNALREEAEILGLNVTAYVRMAVTVYVRQHSARKLGRGEDQT